MVFLINTIGYYFVYRVNQSVIRYETRAMIHSGFHKELFIIISIRNPETNRNFKKLDRDEFSYYGKLYDVVSESVHGNIISYYCLNDRQEDRLLAGFERIKTFASTPGSREGSKQLLSFCPHFLLQALVNGHQDLLKPGQCIIRYPRYFTNPFKTVLNTVPHPPKFPKILMKITDSQA